MAQLKITPTRLKKDVINLTNQYTEYSKNHLYPIIQWNDLYTNYKDGLKALAKVLIYNNYGSSKKEILDYFQTFNMENNINILYIPKGTLLYKAYIVFAMHFFVNTHQLNIELIKQNDKTLRTAINILSDFTALSTSDSHSGLYILSYVHLIDKKNHHILSQHDCNVPSAKKYYWGVPLFHTLFNQSDNYSEKDCDMMYHKFLKFINCGASVLKTSQKKSQSLKQYTKNINKMIKNIDDDRTREAIQIKPFTALSNLKYKHIRSIWKNHEFYTSKFTDYQRAKMYAFLKDFNRIANQQDFEIRKLQRPMWTPSLKH